MNQSTSSATHNNANTTTTPVGFYLHTPAARESIVSSKDSNSEYIILMNDTLSQEIRTITRERDELVQTNNEQERDMDRSETSTQYLRKLLTNLVELKKMSYTLKDSYHKLYEDALEQFKQSDKYLCMFYSMAKRYLVINVVIALTLWAMGQLDVAGMLNHLLVEFIAVTILVTNHLDTFRPQDINDHFKQKLKWLSNKEKSLVKLNELEDEIKSVEDGHDYLNELITLA